MEAGDRQLPFGFWEDSLWRRCFFECVFILGDQSRRISPSPEDLWRHLGSSLNVSAPEYVLLQYNQTLQTP